MPNDSSVYANPNLLVIFMYAPAGLGHLRVTDALWHGLPEGIHDPLLLGSDNTTITFFHRLMSINPLIRQVSEWLERGWGENITTALYRWELRNHSKLLYKQMIGIINNRYNKPKEILIIATHFGLAHQLSAIKNRLMLETGIRIILVVQVTDDSPHHIWYIPGADLIIVPSEGTKRKLEIYGKRIHSSVRFVVNAYPLSPVIDTPLTDEQMKNRTEQVDITKQNTIHMIIPISGAAVGTDFFTKLIHQLHGKSNRFIFHVVAKDAPFTRNFVRQMLDLPYVDLSVASADREVIDNYERIYQQTVISLEVTKPSEQSFKALVDCSKQGASLLIFTEPVGRQEEDNLAFLKRHHLMPSFGEQKMLWQYAKTDVPLSKEEKETVLRKATSWRGISLPHHSLTASHFIWWCLREGIFTAMLHCRMNHAKHDSHSIEVNAHGVESFWEIVAPLL